MVGIRMSVYNAITFFVSLVLSCAAECTAQSPESGGSGSTSATPSERVGGPFENAEVIYVGMPDSISAIDTSEGWAQWGQKLLLTGTIYKRNGRTPAPNVCTESREER
jgi:protocatechuate 3,4-dioxygenase beta subunit